MVLVWQENECTSTVTPDRVAPLVSTRSEPVLTRRLRQRRERSRTRRPARKLFEHFDGRIDQSIFFFVPWTYQDRRLARRTTRQLVCRFTALSTGSRRKDSGECRVVPCSTSAAHVEMSSARRNTSFLPRFEVNGWREGAPPIPACRKAADGCGGSPFEMKRVSTARSFTVAQVAVEDSHWPRDFSIRCAQGRARCRPTRRVGKTSLRAFDIAPNMRCQSRSRRAVVSWAFFATNMLISSPEERLPCWRLVWPHGHGRGIEIRVKRSSRSCHRFPFGFVALG